ncbi:MAG: sulfide/dihydroorotate dehydrogenase-like FAD/NAD-binding protein [Kiritimatiellae bacterium]|nr:sulfide/dihydroorotate dehydrogenase-like FAD/NAD-binding protein [Kiritimatiellia bacterium]
MARILEKTRLSESVYRMKLEAPLIAKGRKAGQFIILRTDAEWGERIPLTIADADPARGSIDIVFQTVGVTTKRLSAMEVGDRLADLTGPLGRPTEITDYGTASRRGWVVVVGGGIGVAPAHPIAQAFKAAGNRVTVIMGARTRELVIMEDEMRRAADEVIIVTDDGSYGRKALVTAPLAECCERAERPDEVVVVGPPVMMKFAAAATKPFGVKTIASLNSIMIDGTGMCGGCRVTVGGETKFVCVDGPEFDAHQVDFDGFIRRGGTFRREEAAHKCRSGLFGGGEGSK